MLGLPIKWLGGSLLVVLASAGGVFYFWGRGEPMPRLETLPELVYGRVTDQIVEDTTIPPGAAHLLLPPFPRDPQDALRRRLAERFQDRHALEVTLPKRRVELLEGGDDWESLIGAVVADWKQKLIAEWQDDGPDFMVVARVTDYTDDDSSVRLAVDWEKRSLNGADKAAGNGESEIAKSWFSVDYARFRISEWSGPWRFALWLAAMAAPAFLCAGFIRRVLEQNSNLSNARLVLAFAVPGAVAAWVLTAFGWGWTGGSLALLGTAVAGVYSFFFCTAVENLRR